MLASIQKLRIPPDKLLQASSQIHGVVLFAS